MGMTVTMSVPEPELARRTRRNRVQFVLIIALFLVPPVAAWVAWQQLSQGGARATTNAGALISPARPLNFAGLARPDATPYDAADQRGRWTYVLFADADCADRCRDQLYLTRQIRLGVNKDIPRVQRLLVLERAPDPALREFLQAEHADLTTVVRSDAAADWVDTFRGNGFAPDGAQYFLVDPLGNLMMSYDPDVPAKGVLRDLQKLLKISQVG